MDFGTLGIFCGHGAVYDTDVAVDDPHLLHTIAVVATRSLANVDAFNEQPQQLRRQLGYIRVATGFLNEGVSFSSFACFSGMAAASCFCSVL